MADRKQFSSVRESNSQLRVLLQEAGKKQISEQQLKEQRVSFAFGNAPESELITKESVQYSSEHIRLKR